MRMFITLQHKCAGSFSHHKTISVEIKGPGSGFRIIVPFRQGLHGVKSTHTGFIDHIF